jgi:acetyl-CoA/propionyl-CoA carboxylase biotin carboxyl carrier protein
LAILKHPDFAAFKHSTKWVEEVLDLSGIENTAPATSGEDAEPLVRRNTTVEINGKRFDVAMWVPEQTAVISSGAPKAAKPKRAAGSGAGGGAGSGQVTVPMQGTIVKVLVEVGQEVESGQAVCVLEAMKMENQILAEKTGKVTYDMALQFPNEEFYDENTRRFFDNLQPCHRITMRNTQFIGSLNGMRGQKFLQGLQRMLTFS